jgi:hypothetical protein
MNQNELDLLAAALYCIDRATPWGSGLKTFKKFPQGFPGKDKIDGLTAGGLLKLASLFINQITNQNESKNSSESRTIIENILK